MCRFSEQVQSMVTGKHLLQQSRALLTTSGVGSHISLYGIEIVTKLFHIRQLADLQQASRIPDVRQAVRRAAKSFFLK